MSVDFPEKMPPEVLFGENPTRIKKIVESLNEIRIWMTSFSTNEIDVKNKE